MNMYPDFCPNRIKNVRIKWLHFILLLLLFKNAFILSYVYANLCTLSVCMEIVQIVGYMKINT